MKPLYLALVLALSAGAASAQSTSARSLTVTGVKEAAFIAQRNGGASAQIGPLAISSRGYSTLKMATPAGGSPGGLPMVPVSTPTPEDVALEAARVWAETNMPGYAGRVGGWLRRAGVGIGYYSFEQNIVINSVLGGNRPKKISFIAAIDSGGKSMWGNPKIIDDNPLILDVNYTPKHTANNLPDSWNYSSLPGAEFEIKPGKLLWRIVDINGNPSGSLGMWHETPGVDGQFDPSTRNGATVDVTEKVPCLVDNRNPGCNTGLPDVRKMMSETGASFGRVSVLRPVEPEYVSAGDGDQMPVGTVIITRREATCTTLREWGNFQVMLNLRADQFIVKPASPRYRFEAGTELVSQGMSPITDYYSELDWNDAWPANQDQPHNWRNVMLSPIQEEDIMYWLRNDDPARMALLIQDAPLTTLENIDNCPRNTSRDPVGVCYAPFVTAADGVSCECPLPLVVSGDGLTCEPPMVP